MRTHLSGGGGTDGYGIILRIVEENGYPRKDVEVSSDSIHSSHAPTFVQTQGD
jgi:hypothetical protein